MSMFCMCGVKARNADSRYNKETRITRRQYHCTCGHRWTTLEIEMEDTFNLHMTLRRADQIRMALTMMKGLTQPIGGKT